MNLAIMLAVQDPDEKTRPDCVSDASENNLADEASECWYSLTFDSLDDIFKRVYGRLIECLAG